MKPPRPTASNNASISVSIILVFKYLRSACIKLHSRLNAFNSSDKSASCLMGYCGFTL
ncbi:unnamed protein product [Schistosoma mattheei]|uniref:Uncharacterized protein n=1 Tax=Schistosoma mattheei TaxID=31246 RepID=A0A183PIH9_9TREM|nr:unnamed protein product [Schistosoma mattheei]